MGNGRKAFCFLCQRSEETKITGALSTKEEVTAHQDCLLYSSGIYSTDSPAQDDLFGFSVADVMDEVKRGSRLICYHCKKKGATVGCEVKRCKKSFHYPCAVLCGDVPFVDDQNGKYGVYCSHHYEQKKGDCVNVIRKPQSSNGTNEAGPSKALCLTCEKTEENISLESLSNSVFMLYCDKHAPSSYKRKISNNGDSSRPGPSSWSSTSSSVTHCSSKKQLDFNDNEEEEPPIKRKYKRARKISEDSLNPDDDSWKFPLESDIDDSGNSSTEQRLVLQQLSQEPESPSDSLAGNLPVADIEDVINDEEDINSPSDTESESLLSTVKNLSVAPEASALTASAAETQSISVQVQTIKKELDGLSPEQSPEQDPCGPSVPQQNYTAPLSPPSPPSEYSIHCNVTDSPPCRITPASSPAPLEPNNVSLHPSTSFPHTSASDLAPPSDPESNIDSSNFWRSCNTAGCTQDIFTDFMNEMNEISSRIQADQASKEDYDRALSVMAASGRLAEFVAKQQEELQRKQMELQKAAEAMKDIFSALKK